MTLLQGVDIIPTKCSPGLQKIHLEANIEI